MLALYAVIAAALPAAFWPVRDVPKDWDCGEDEPPGQAAKLDAFQAGAIPLHAVAALVLLGGLCVWSARRKGGTVGAPTGIAAVLLLGYLVLMLAWNDAYLPLGAAAILLGAVYVTPVVLLVLAGLSLARTRGRDTAVAALGWALLLLGLPLHLDLVMLQGEGPWFC